MTDQSIYIITTSIKNGCPHKNHNGKRCNAESYSSFGYFNTDRQAKKFLNMCKKSKDIIMTKEMIKNSTILPLNIINVPK